MPIMREDINFDGNQKLNFWEMPKTRKKWVQILKCELVLLDWKYFQSCLWQNIVFATIMNTQNFRLSVERKRKQFFERTKAL